MSSVLFLFFCWFFSLCSVLFCRGWYRRCVCTGRAPAAGARCAVCGTQCALSRAGIPLVWARGAVPLHPGGNIHAGHVLGCGAGEAPFACGDWRGSYKKPASERRPDGQEEETRPLGSAPSAPRCGPARLPRGHLAHAPRAFLAVPRRPGAAGRVSPWHRPAEHLPRRGSGRPGPGSGAGTAGEPGAPAAPAPAGSSSGLPAPGPRDAERRPSSRGGERGLGWDGMGAGEGTSEPAGGFKCGPGRAPPAEPLLAAAARPWGLLAGAALPRADRRQRVARQAGEGARIHRYIDR